MQASTTGSAACVSLADLQTQFIYLFIFVQYLYIKERFLYR